MCNTHFAYYSQGRHKPTNYDKYFPIKYFQREKWGRTGLVEDSLRKTWLVTWVVDREVVLCPSLYIYMFDKMTAKLRATLRISEILKAKSQNLWWKMTAEAKH